MSKSPYKSIPLVKLKMVKQKTIKYVDHVNQPSKMVSIARPLFNGLDREYFIVVGLNSSNIPTIVNIVSIGGINRTIIDTSCVFKSLILSNSASFICLHNHPSGDVNVSHEDVETTHKLKEAGDLMGIKMLDHIIVGDKNRYLSLQEARML